MRILELFTTQKNISMLLLSFLIGAIAGAVCVALWTRPSRSTESYDEPPANQTFDQFTDSNFFNHN